MYRKNEMITIFSIQTIRYFLTDNLYFTVQVIIGSYLEKPGIFDLEKCFAT